MVGNRMVAPGTSSRWAALLRTMLIAFGFFLLGSLSDLWLQRHVGTSLSIAIIDDALVGMGAGLLVFLYERRQRQNIIRKLEVIRLMNHHVRNSLQVISFAASVPQREELTDRVQEAVRRIEWALREVLPGQKEDISDLLTHPRSHDSPPSPEPRSVGSGVSGN
jgi:signal transduction histidine kinase